MYDAGKLLKILFFTLFISFSFDAIGAEVVQNKESDALFYLRLIFGDVVNLLIDEQGPASTSPDTVLGAMTLKFNQIIMTLSILGIGFVGLMAFFETIHTTTVNTNKYDSMLFLRYLIVLAALVPVSGGFNTFHLGTLYVAGSGVQVADEVAKTSVNFVQRTGSVVKLNANVDHESFLMSLLESKVCKYAVNITTNHENIIEKYISSTYGENAGTAVGLRQAPAYDSLFDAKAAALSATLSAEFQNPLHFDSESPCGSFQLSYDPVELDNNELQELKNIYLNSYAQALNSASLGIEVLAQKIAQKSLDSTVVVPPDAFDNVLANLSNAHREILDNIGTSAYSLYTGDSGSGLMPEDNVRRYGFIHYGSLYLRWTKITKNMMLITKGVDISSNRTIDTKILSNYDMKIFFSTLADYLNKDRLINVGDSYVLSSTFKPGYFPQTSIMSSNESDELASEAIQNELEAQEAKIQKAEKLISSAKEYVIDGLINTTNDPLTTTINMGNNLITLAEVAQVANLIIKSGIKTFELAKDSADNTTVGAYSNLLLAVPSGIFLAIAQELASKTLTLIIACIVLGSIASFYIPAVPLFHWILGVISWAASVIEAVFLSPILALAHIPSEGKGLIGDRAKAGYQLLLSVFLRPVMMVFGFTAAIMLCMIGGMINLLLFGPFFSDLLNDTWFFYIDLIAVTGLFLIINITIIQRSFALITELGDKALRYFGGGQESFNDSAYMGQLESKFSIIGGVVQTGGSSDIKKPSQNSNERQGK